jgi:hypothetical protein
MPGCTSGTSDTGGGCSEVGDTGSELGCRLSLRFGGVERVKEFISNGLDFGEISRLSKAEICG